MQEDPADFVEFATARSGSLFRTALLLCVDQLIQFLEIS